MRQSRKLDHLKYAMEIKDGPARNGFEDISLIHNCLPDMAADEVDLSCRLLGMDFEHPIIINAITGGDKDVAEINRLLAEFAKLTGSAMAVGSQYAAIENSSVEESFKIVRQVNPNGLIFANLGAHASPEQALTAVEMIGAQAIQIHLNTAQELVMSEGDRDFRGYLTNISEIVEKVNIPVIVKEVGCGIAHEQASSLARTGVAAIDVGGAGGTNFVAIEAARNKSDLDMEMLTWGIPTAVSAIETLNVLPSNISVVISGGIRSPLEVVKALALGGSAVGIANPIVKMIKEHDLDTATANFCEFLKIVKRYFVLVGAKNVAELRNRPVVITGNTKDWLTTRNIDVKKYSRT